MTEPAVTASTHDEYEEATGTPAIPSPTESVGCHPHGDHWHCDGPRVTSTVAESDPVSSVPPSSTASSPAEFDGAAGALRPGGVTVLALVAVAAYYV